MKTCLIPCDGWSPWSLMGQCFQVQDLFVCSAHRTVRLASTCKASSASNILLGCPSYCELQRALTNTSLFCQTPACVGSLDRHQGQKLSRLSVHGGTKDKGMNKIHPLLPGVAPGPLRLAVLSSLFPFGTCRKK